MKVSKVLQKSPKSFHRKALSSFQGGSASPGWRGGRGGWSKEISNKGLSIILVMVFKVTLDEVSPCRIKGSNCSSGHDRPGTPMHSVVRCVKEPDMMTLYWKGKGLRDHREEGLGQGARPEVVVPPGNAPFVGGE